ncbi:hypothetical protein [Mariniradius sediminis]|uniref:Outer membrane protein beta-barrel domain-containing protein n=1 Tax=Mariniradius sediminis TaxID=2909237 RepID=A0ABS9BTB7_9BACT|nr:hypothetical protein [Mariniradius sediminis]MCF1750841.1 hypothetical protein [Mariniradius sediminis]
MKLRILILIVLLSTGILSAQESQPRETLLGQNSFKNVGFAVTAGVAGASFDGASVLVGMSRAGAVFSDKIGIGGFYNLSLNDFVPESETDPNTYMDFRWVGGYVEYTWRAHKKVHFTFPLLIGGAELELDREGPSSTQFGEANFLLVEPSALLELNLTKNIRLLAGAGYRFAGDFAYRSIESADISGFSGQIALKLGIFP